MYVCKRELKSVHGREREKMQRVYVEQKEREYKGWEESESTKVCMEQRERESAKIVFGAQRDSVKRVHGAERESANGEQKRVKVQRCVHGREKESNSVRGREGM